MTSRILVVDDLLPNIRLLEAKLTNEYYDVITSQSGSEALILAEKNQPDLILLDVMMPEMDGFEACRRLKKNPKTADIPVVMVTALSDVEDRVQGLNAGADDFLTKPINDLALFARIRSLVRIKSMTDELRLRDQTGEALGAASDKIATTNITEGAKILVIDDDVAEAHQITDKLKEYGIEVVIIPNPRDAINACNKTDFDLIMVSTQLTSDDGLHLCTHFRSLDTTRNTPLLILIEDSNTDLLVKGLDMGINDYLVTPIDSNEVIARVRIQVRRKRYQDALKANQEKSLSMAVTDALTGLYNRRYFDIHLDKMLKNSLVTNKPLSVMIVDIDHFKKVNDSYGHLSGDEILKQVPQRILKNIRPTDLAVRYGGEEFVIVFPDTSIKQAAGIAERIRRSIESRQFDISVDPYQIKCTISSGLSSYVHSDANHHTLIERADKALYHVKKTGRNRVAVFCAKE